MEAGIDNHHFNRHEGVKGAAPKGPTSLLTLLKTKLKTQNSKLPRMKRC